MASTDEPMFTLAKRLDTVGTPVTLVLSQDRWQALSAFFQLRNFTLWVTLACVILAALAGMMLARRLTNSLSLLASTAQRMQQGAYDNALVESPHQEVRDLSSALNTMQEVACVTVTSMQSAQ